MAYQTRKQLKAEIERLKAQAEGSLDDRYEVTDTLARLALHFGIGDAYGVFQVHNFTTGNLEYRIHDEILREDLLLITPDKYLKEARARLTPRAPETKDEED